MILGIALWKWDIGPRLGFPEVSGLPGQRGRPSWKNPRTGPVESRGGVSEGMGWPGAGEPGLECVPRETSDIPGRYAVQEAAFFDFQRIRQREWR